MHSRRPTHSGPPRTAHPLPRPVGREAGLSQPSRVQRPVARVLIPAMMLAMAAATVAMPATARAEIPFNPNIVADVAEKVTPAVVNITTRRDRRNPMARRFREFFRRLPPEMGAGSGVVISANGDIVTNNHVVEGADEIRVAFADNREYRAKLVGADKSSDLAFLKIEAKNLPYLEIGDSKELRLGEFVLAVGNPFGVGQTVTMGIVSAKGRANIGIVDYEDFIQTDASINPGNSGGALVNLRGQLVGINTAILSRSGGAQGIGFAVPTTMVKPIRDQIAKYGRVRRGWLGVSIQDLTPDLARTLGLNKVDGVLVSDVLRGGPASRSDLRAGDVIVAVNDRPTKTSAQLRNRIALTRPGTKAKLDVVRDKKNRQSVYVTLDEKDEDGPVASRNGSNSDDILDGVEVVDLSRELRQRLRVPTALTGVVVSDVAPGSPADEAGLQSSDIIVEVKGERVTSVQQLNQLVSQYKKEVLLRVFTRGSFQYLVISR